MRHYTESDIQQIAKSLKLTHKAQQLLSVFILKRQPLKSQDIIDYLPNAKSRQQAVRELKPLISIKLINKEGSGPSTRYSLNQQILSHAFISLNYLKRSPVSYNPSRLKEYTPNKDYYLTPEIREEFFELSKATIQKGETINDKIFKRLLIDFSWMSSKLEGNTYSLLETTELIENNIAADNKTREETQMVRNHAEGVSFIIKNNKSIIMRPVEIRSLHSLLSKNLLSNPNDSGNIRNQIVDIGQSKYMPEHNSLILKQQFELLCKTVINIENPFEQSFFLLINIPYLQPFIDINKRTGRLSSNIPLLKNNLCPNSFYGIDEKKYLQGLLEYYETGETLLLQQTLLDSYRLSTRQYQQALNSVYDTQGHRYHNLKSNLIKEWINEVIHNKHKNNFNKEYLTQWIHQHVHEQSATSHLIQDISDVDEFSALSSGASILDYQKFITLINDRNH